MSDSPESPRLLSATEPATEPAASPMTASPMTASAAPTRSAPDAAVAARLLADLSAAARRGAGPAPDPLSPLPQIALTRGRVHEFTGPARRTLAAAAAGAAQAEGPVMWLRPAWRVEGLCPQGLAALLPDPGALIIVNCTRPVDVLWSMEEALRAGCVALVIAEIVEPPDLRQVRRLHLAADDGLARNRLAGRSRPAPLGVMLAHETADSRVTGVESRWALHPLPPEGRDAPRWRLDRQRVRGLPPKDWAVRFPRVTPAPVLSERTDLAERTDMVGARGG